MLCGSFISGYHMRLFRFCFLGRRHIYIGRLAPWQWRFGIRGVGAVMMEDRKGKMRMCKMVLEE
jgi:hypothetical protein